MEIEYVIVDFKRKIVSVRNPESVDVEYYRKLLEKAYGEVEFAVRSALSSPSGTPQES